MLVPSIVYLIRWVFTLFQGILNFYSGAVLLSIGFVSLFRIRSSIRKSGGPDIHDIDIDKLEKLIIKIAIFSVLYTFPGKDSANKRFSTVFSRFTDWSTVLRKLVARRSPGEADLCLSSGRNQVYRNWGSSCTVALFNAFDTRNRGRNLDMYTKGLSSSCCNFILTFT